MRIGYLAAFEKNSSGSRSWAAWHNKNSITWRWMVSANMRKTCPTFLFYGHIKHNTGRSIKFGIWRVVLQIHTQNPMWPKA